MVRFEDRHAVRKLLRVLGFLFPREIQDPVEIPRNDGVFGGSGLHFIQTVQFFKTLFFHLFGKPFGEDPDAVFVLFLSVVAQFRMNGFELFAQEIILLRAVDILTDGGSDLLFDFGDFQLVV